jgi:hypothetical protein
MSLARPAQLQEFGYCCYLLPLFRALRSFGAGRVDVPHDWFLNLVSGIVQDPWQQQDVHEVMIRLLEHVPVGALPGMSFTWSQRLRLLSGVWEYGPPGVGRVLELTVGRDTGVTSVFQLISELTAIELVDDYIERQAVFSLPPDVLLISLGRWTNISDITARSDRRVRVPPRVNFDYLLGAATPGGPRPAPPEEEWLLRRDPNAAFDPHVLRGVLCHVGGLHSGHYFAFIHTRRQWFRLDDENVTAESPFGPFVEATVVAAAYVRESLAARLWQ